jgi:hypothetical protein
MRALIREISRTLGFNPLPIAWLRDTWRMRKRVRDFEMRHPPKQDAIRFAIVVMPWGGTPVPWFSLVCGLLLASSGNKVTFIVDDMPFGEHGLSFRFQIGCMRAVLRLLRDRHDIITLSDHALSGALTHAAQQSVERLAELNAVWALRGEIKVAGRQRYTERAIRQLSASYAVIAGIQLGDRYDALFVPGGVWGSSGVWVEHARAAGVRVASYDSGGYSNLLLAVNGVACQLQDIPRAFSLLKTHAASREEQAFIIESTLAEIGRRRSGTDNFSSQMQGTLATDGRFARAVLVALNSSWDSAALGLHAVFENNTQWIVETTKYLLEHTPASVIVRQHPVERLDIARTSDDYRSLLTHHFGEHPRLHFVAANEPVNSYDLLEQVAAVVVHTSTIGTEAAAYGKAVVTGSASYYADLGFVRKATNLAQYWQYLSDAVSGRYVVTPAMRDDALWCYYLTQCCNWVFTPFTPTDFAEWSRHDLDQLGQHESVRAVIQALEQNIPVAFLNHLARLEHQPRQG